MQIKLRPHGSNRTEVMLEDRSLYFSYETVVVVQVARIGWYQTRQKYSATTSRHITGFLDGIAATLVTQAVLEQLADGVHPHDLEL